MDVFEMIEAQQAKLSDTEPAWMVGEHLKDICRADPRCAELVEKDLEKKEMSLKCAEKELRSWAGKQKRTGNCVCVHPKKAEEIIRKFYGLPEVGTPKEEPKKTGVIDLFSFV